MKKRPHSMKWKVIRILLLCWLIPLFLFIVVLGGYVGTNHMEITVQNYQKQLEFNNRICVERLNGAVSDSRQASYDGEILSTLEKYENGLLSYTAAKKNYSEYLSSKYQKSNAISAAILWFQKDDTKNFSSAYSEIGNGTYQQIRTYWKRDHQAVAELAETLDTSVGFLVRNNILYLIRNLKDSQYVTKAVLVLRLNQSYCFDSIRRFPMGEQVAVQLNEQPFLLVPAAEQTAWAKRFDKYREQTYGWPKGQLCVMDTASGDGYQIHSSMLIDHSVTKFPFYGYPYVLGAMILSMLIMLAAILGVFRKEVSSPVEKLTDGMHHIEQGELGYQVSGAAANLEFEYLTAAVNQMSKNLEEQILKSYQEEIALKEARIMALQSHINPHFMNNTLEIINWEARLSGNIKVSQMIGALSTMMDAVMDRRKRPEIQLAEEMGYVNSYLYIMRERLGKRLTVTIDIPEELMSCMVPRLILQPLIENAIEHGVVPNGSGEVILQGIHDDTYLYLETRNNGGLSEDDKERISRLLDPDYNTSKEPSGNLGIANVNQRLRILFGSPCGLDIREQNGCVLARLTIPYRQQKQNTGIMTNKSQEITV
jgi:two-component system sensor histidine kinase YesM